MSQPKPAAPYSEALFAVLITFLTPLFLGGPTGNTDLAMARAAAIEMVSGFRIRSAWDLFTVCQIVANSAAAFGSICLSMREDASVNAILRCRANAASLQRAADRAQDRLDRRHAELPPDLPNVEPPDEAAVLETFRHVAEAHCAVAQARAALTGDPADAAVLQALSEACGTPEPPRPAAAPEPARAPEIAAPDLAAPDLVVPDTAAPDLAAPDLAAPDTAAPDLAMPDLAAPDTAAPDLAAHTPMPAPPASVQPQAAAAPAHHDLGDLQQNIVWAEAMATVAAELSQEMPHLPPAEQQKHRIRIAALSTAAQDLTRGTTLDPWSLPGAPRTPKPAARDRRSPPR